MKRVRTPFRVKPRVRYFIYDSEGNIVGNERECNEDSLVEVKKYYEQNGMRVNLIKDNPEAK